MTQTQTRALTYSAAEIALKIPNLLDFWTKEKIWLTAWSNVLEFVPYFLLFLLGATVLLGIFWAKYSK